MILHSWALKTNSSTECIAVFYLLRGNWKGLEGPTVIFRVSHIFSTYILGVDLGYILLWRTNSK